MVSIQNWAGAILILDWVVFKRDFRPHVGDGKSWIIARALAYRDDLDPKQRAIILRLKIVHCFPCGSADVTA